MKQMMLFSALLIMIACNNGEINVPNNENIVTWEVNGTDDYESITQQYNFIVGKNGEITPENNLNLLRDIFQSSIARHGWKYIAGYNINADGSIDMEECITTFPQAQAKIPNYFLEDGTTKEFACMEGIQGIYYVETYGYTYDEQTSTISFDRKDRKENLTLLSYEERTRTMVVMRYEHRHGYSKGNYQILCYQAMPDDEVEDLFKAYEKSPYHFSADETGYIVPTNIDILTRERFDEGIVGYGWKNISQHLINNGGTIDTDEYTAMWVGKSPIHIYFGEGNVTQYFNYDALPVMCYYTQEYVYNSDKNHLAFKDNSTEMVVLTYNAISELMATLVKDGKQYYLVFYKRMSKEELKDMQNSYATNYEDIRAQ